MTHAYTDPETGDTYPAGCNLDCQGCEIPECHREEDEEITDAERIRKAIAYLDAADAIRATDNERTPDGRPTIACLLSSHRALSHHLAQLRAILTTEKP